MNTTINKIYDMMLSPIITPYNLLENAKLDNYEYVKYYKSEIGLVAEMKCIIESDSYSTFYYNFDSKDHLQTIIMETKEVRKKIYDRLWEVENAKAEHYEMLAARREVI